MAAHKVKTGDRVTSRDGVVYQVINSPMVAEDGREYAPVRRYCSDPIPMLVGKVSHKRADELRLVREEPTWN